PPCVPPNAGSVGQGADAATRTPTITFERVTRGVRQVLPSTYGQLGSGPSFVESVPYAQLGCVDCQSAVKRIRETASHRALMASPGRGARRLGLRAASRTGTDETRIPSLT